MRHFVDLSLEPIGIYCGAMGSDKLKIPPEFTSASKEQQIEFVHELWDQIARNPGTVPVSEEHKLILKERLAAYREDTRQGKPWHEVRDQILGKIGKV